MKYSYFNHFKNKYPKLLLHILKSNVLLSNQFQRTTQYKIYYGTCVYEDVSIPKYKYLLYITI